MKIIELDCAEMTSKEEAHRYLKDQFQFPDYYGENLDALWDELSTFAEDTLIEIRHREAVECLGSYGIALLNTMIEACEANLKLKLNFTDNSLKWPLYKDPPS